MLGSFKTHWVLSSNLQATTSSIVHPKLFRHPITLCRQCLGFLFCCCGCSIVKVLTQLDPFSLLGQSGLSKAGNYVPAHCTIVGLKQFAMLVSCLDYSGCQMPAFASSSAPPRLEEIKVGFGSLLRI